MSRRPLTAYFENDRDGLFIASEPALKLHQAGKPSSVYKRAGVAATAYNRWVRRSEKEPWLLSWLYGEPLPREVKLHYPAWSRSGHRVPANAFAPDDEMLCFRREATANAVMRAADAEATKLLKRWRGLPWFRNWLLRGDEGPPIANPTGQPSDKRGPADLKVTVTTATQSKRAAEAWDYLAIVKAARSKFSGRQDKRGLSELAFEKWFRFNLIPQGEQRLPFVRWLYGAPEPKGWFVVSETMQRFREESTVFDGVCRAAKCRAANVYTWKRDQQKAEALAVALQEAAKGRTHAPVRLQNHPGYQALDSRGRKAIWRFAAASSLASRSKRASVCKQEYFTWLAQAERIGGATLKEQVAKYLNGEPARRHGAIADKLFVPVKAMYKFRAVARRYASDAKLAEALRSLPEELAARWMLSWATPGGSTEPQTNEHPHGSHDQSTTGNGQPEQRPSRRGPQFSEETKAVYRACYEGMAAGKPLKTVRREVAEAFPEPKYSPPKTNAAVSIYAGRYAKRANKPWPIQRSNP